MLKTHRNSMHKFVDHCEHIARDKVHRNTIAVITTGPKAVAHFAAIRGSQ